MMQKLFLDFNVTGFGIFYRKCMWIDSKHVESESYSNPDVSKIETIQKNYNDS